MQVVGPEALREAEGEKMRVEFYISHGAPVYVLATPGGWWVERLFSPIVVVLVSDTKEMG